LHSVGCSQPDAQVFIKQWDKPNIQKAVHGFIEPDVVIETLPLTIKGWHGGGASNNDYLGFEMTEPSTIKYTGGASFIDNDYTKTKSHVLATYKVAVEYFASLCVMFKLDPLGKNVIISHSEGHKLGIASAHADVEHLWSKFGLTMDNFRNEVNELVKKSLEPVKTEAEIAREYMIKEGITDGSNPQNPCTREQMWVMLYRLLKK